MSSKKKASTAAHLSLALSASTLVALGVAACSGEAPGPGADAPGAEEELATPAAMDRALMLYQDGRDRAAVGDAAGAAELYRQALAVDEELVEAHFDLGRALVALSYVKVARGGDAPGAGGGGVTLGRNDKVLDEGITHLQRAKELAPNSAEYAYWVGRALHVRGDNEGALTALRDVIERDPEHGQAHKRMGLVLLDLGEPEEAKESFRLAMEHLTTDPGAAFQYGNLLAEDDPEGARAAYESAIEIDPTFPWAYNGLVSVLSRLGDEEAAAQAMKGFEVWRRFDDELSAAVQRANQNPSDPAAQIAAGEKFFVTKKWAEALEYFQRALILDSSNAQPFLYAGIVQRNVGQYEASRLYLQEATLLAPESLQPPLEMLQLYGAMQDEELLGELQAELEAESVDWGAPERLSFAEALLEVGRSAAAEAQYRAVLAAEPGNAQATAGLARAQEEGAQ